MKKGARKSGSSALNKKISKEINLMHKATAEFVGVCIDIAKAHPKGLNRIKKHVVRITNNMLKLDNMYSGLRK